MSRRKHRGELDIGSDSFLDIIANMVGILIILIVLAGLQVKDLPLSKMFSSAPADPLPQPVVTSTEPVNAPPMIVEEFADDVAVAVIPPTVTIEDNPLTAPPPEHLIHDLETKIARLRSDLSRTNETLSRLQVDFNASRDKTLALQQRRQQLETVLDESTRAIEERRAAYRQTRLKLESIKGDYLNVQAAIEKAREEVPPAKKIEHSLTAVSHEVLGEEWHFRIENDHVAYVPVKELIERVQEQMQSRKELLLKHSRYQSEIGPIEGFTMQYTMEKQSLSIVDELRYGQGMMRIGLSEWRIDPDPGYRGESLDRALKSRSRFQRQLHMIDPGATLTFWVYPDGFDTFRMVQAFTRDKGYVVAGRPLPQGVPISGSPQGTRSAGQ